MKPDILDPSTKVVDQLPPPSTWLNYAGDQSAMTGRILGPNTLGEVLTVVSCAYDPQTDRSRVGLAFGVYIVPVDVPGLPASGGAA
jgi:hypothetical protein